MAKCRQLIVCIFKYFVMANSFENVCFLSEKILFAHIGFSVAEQYAFFLRGVETVGGFGLSEIGNADIRGQFFRSIARYRFENAVEIAYGVETAAVGNFGYRKVGFVTQDFDGFFHAHSVDILRERHARHRFEIRGEIRLTEADERRRVFIGKESVFFVYFRKQFLVSLRRFGDRRRFRFGGVFPENTYYLAYEYLFEHQIVKRTFEFYFVRYVFVQLSETFVGNDRGNQFFFVRYAFGYLEIVCDERQYALRFGVNEMYVARIYERAFALFHRIAFTVDKYFRAAAFHVYYFAVVVPVGKIGKAFVSARPYLGFVIVYSCFVMRKHISSSP